MEDKANVWKPLDTGKWTKTQWVAGYLSDCGIDPYFIWADLTGFTYFAFDADDSTRIPFILELTGEARAFCKHVHEAKWHWIAIPPLYLEPARGLEKTRYCTAHVTCECFRRLGELGNRVKRFALQLPVDTGPTEDEAEPEAFSTPRPSPSPDEAPPKVVIGLIDDGLPVAHERVRGWRGDPASSRVRYCWTQDGTTLGVPCSVAGVDYGRELSQQQIDEAIRRSTRAGLIDEDVVYRGLGLWNCRRYATHGAAVMDLACGEDPARSPAQAPDIICVELPRRTTADTSGASLAVHVLDALRYILDRADRLAGSADAPPPQVVVNLSYGYFAGPHDGSSILESAIDELIEQRGQVAPFAVVLPAGNCYLSRCHGRHRLEPGASGEFAWHILPDDATPSFVEIWPSAADAQLQIEIVGPEGISPEERSSGTIGEGQIQGWMRGEDPVCTVIHLGRVASGDGKMVLVCVAPTVAGANCPTVAPSGVWTIRVSNAGARPIQVDAWIQRDDAVSGYRPRGRQSRFVDGKYERFDLRGQAVEHDNDSYIKRDGTLNAIATGEHTVVVGGYRDSDGAVAAYSAGGDDDAGNPAAKAVGSGRDRAVRGPDALAMSERSPGRPGVLVAGSRSGGSKLALTGTSVAAPQVTRLIAAMMGRGEYRDRHDVAAEAGRQDPLSISKYEPPPGVPPAKPTPKRGGRGRLKPFRKDDERAIGPPPVGEGASG
jgi:hypothetical protein